tara:strand:- start:434 stop:1495 length:1062 start_codon:yes stop_codon:yes gene_type:complete
MQPHSLHNPILLIDNTEVKSFISGAFTDGGSNQLQTLNASFTDPDLEDMPLMNKKVELYLNNGSLDGSPIFRGFINQFTPSDNKIKIKALDPRMFITGKNTMPVVIDEKDNYDGRTVIQFLIDYIENEINKNGTLITTDYLKEMDRPVYMTGIRKTVTPYSLVKKMVEEKIDDETETDRTDINAVFDYFFDIIHGNEYSGITLRKRRALNGNADISFRYGDGISRLSYNERPPPSFALGTVDESGEQVVFEYGNAPLGNIGLPKTKISGNSRGEVKENLISKLILEQQFTKEIDLVCTKGYTLGIGNIINIDVPKLNLSGNFAVTGKSINVGKNLVCHLKCNNKPLLLSDYLS